MVARTSFERDLEELNYKIIKMGSLVEASIEKTIYALKNQDTNLAEKIIIEDDIIDNMEHTIETKCLSLIARQQPLARDLRSITAALKIITDMERIADHSADIAELTVMLAEEEFIKPLIDIPKMAEMAKRMVNDSIDAFVRRDIKLAKEVCSSDDYVDNLFDKIKIELANFMKEKDANSNQIIDLLLISKYLERMADHATNIGEWVVYDVTGEHKHLARELHIIKEKQRNHKSKGDEHEK